MLFTKKLYCRAFQTAFKVALPILPYTIPTILQTVKQVPQILIEKKKKKVMIVTDPMIASYGLMNELIESLIEADFPYVIYDKTVANPTTDNVEEVYALYKENHCDAIIGFGGGSSMDCAKALGVRVARPRTSLGTLKGILKVVVPLPLIIAVPTTAGTGSETTLTAVIVDAKTRHKYAVNDFPLIPKYAVLDPKVTVSLPPFVTATTGLDALTHAVEAYIGNNTNKETRRYARRAVKLIFQNLETAYEDGSNLKARRNMLMASFYAGCAFTRSYVGYVHAVAHSLGGAYNVPHGEANAILLPFVLETYGNKIHKKLKDLAIVAGLADNDTEPEVAARHFIDAVQAMKVKFGIKDTVAALEEERIPELARYADKEANPLYPVPVLMDANKLQMFYYMILENK